MTTPKKLPPKRSRKRNDRLGTVIISTSDLSLRFEVVEIVRQLEQDDGMHFYFEYRNMVVVPPRLRQHAPKGPTDITEAPRHFQFIGSLPDRLSSFLVSFLKTSLSRATKLTQIIEVRRSAPAPCAEKA